MRNRERLRRALKVSVFTAALALALNYSQDYFSDEGYWHGHNIIFALAMAMCVFLLMAPLKGFVKG